MRQHNPFIKLRLKVRRDWDSVWPDEEDFEAYKDQDERDLASFRKIRRTERYAMEQSKTDEDKYLIIFSPAILHQNSILMEMVF
jgi:hypothetical protein